MVCEKEKDSTHNFSKDPIKTIIDGDWAKAYKTTLGADNGIALAIGMALAVSDIERPQLELLFTSDEETGLNGAQAIEKNFINSKMLINIDSEDEGVFIIGCAGGIDTDIELDLTFKETDKNYEAYEISLYDLLSGHSGIDINKQRANAIKLIRDLLQELNEKLKIKLVSIEGGSARNAIPKFSKAVILADTNEAEIKKITEEFIERQKNRYPNEKSMKLEINSTNQKKQYISNTKDVFDILKDIPHGVYSMLDDKTPLTSNNLAKVETLQNTLMIHTNQRSLSENGLDKITQKIENTAKKYNAKYKSYNKYPSWQPDKNSKLLQKSIDIYERLFLSKPAIEVIHAGLECGIIGSKVDKIDMISIGPTIKDPHTPNERIYLPSIDKIWKFLTELLREV